MPISIRASSETVFSENRKGIMMLLRRIMIFCMKYALKNASKNERSDCIIEEYEESEAVNEEDRLNVRRLWQELIATVVVISRGKLWGGSKCKVCLMNCRHQVRSNDWFISGEVSASRFIKTKQEL